MLRNMSKKIRARGSRQADAQKKPAWLPHCSGPRKQHFKTRPPRQQQLSLEVSSAWRDRKKHLMIGLPSYLGSKPTRDRGANERGGVPRAKTCLLKKRYNTNRRRFVHYTLLEKLPAPHTASGHRTCTGHILKAPVLHRVQHVLPKYCTIAIEFPSLTV